jgi:hypothetical protein
LMAWMMFISGMAGILLGATGYFVADNAAWRSCPTGARNYARLTKESRGKRSPAPGETGMLSAEVRVPA